MGVKIVLKGKQKSIPNHSRSCVLGMGGGIKSDFFTLRRNYKILEKEEKIEKLG